MIFSHLLNMQSHPSWVCGLKHNSRRHLRCYGCHTLRGCVDWNMRIFPTFPALECHTLRGCVDWNLLHQPLLFLLPSHTLRGCVDWNISIVWLAQWVNVTPFVGVWIETGLACSVLAHRMSHPSWVCGLKQDNIYFGGNINYVTPFVGVWIETSVLSYILVESGSHPSWVCGLKLSDVRWAPSGGRSHPSWVCGLKL